MIPKIIHYIWLGGNPKSKLFEKCLASWKKYCPDYEIKEWNESNFDVNSVPYVKEAYENKKWAFASDYIRLYALCNEGGIYMDTDVEVLKPLDRFLDCSAFSGFESENSVPTGIMGAEKGNEMFKCLLEDYNDRHFINDNGELDLTTNVTTITNICLKKGLQLNNQHQNLDGFELFPKDYFCPKNYETKEIELTNNSYTIHHFDGSWHTKTDKFKAFVIRIIGKERVVKILDIIRGRK